VPVLQAYAENNIIGQEGLFEMKKGPMDGRERTLTLRETGRAYRFGRTAGVTIAVEPAQKIFRRVPAIGRAKSSETEYVNHGSSCAASMSSYLAHHITLQTA